MKCHDSSEKSKYITYLDANNLYGWTMSQYLPYSGFKWLNQKIYPDVLHKLHNHYPLAPGKLEIGQDMLSKYCCNIVNVYGIKIGGVNKLVSNLGNKSKYIVHYRNLQLYLYLGMKLTKVYGVLKFKQSDWLKKYIDFNTDRRKNAANSLEKDLFKLMNNSVFGKRIENLRKRVNVRLVNNAKDYVRYISKPTFVSQKMFCKNFVAIHEIKPVLTLNKPIYVGFSTLDLSKLLMYEFQYKYIKNRFDAKLLLTDTDSIVYEIKTEDIYEDFYQDKNLFDFRHYPLNSNFFDPVNKKVIGKMKDEFKVKIISGICWIKFKDVLIN